jgi:hypothetical protein
VKSGTGGRDLDEEERTRRKRRGKSASGELDGPMRPPRATIFEEVEEDRSGEDLDEFEPVAAEDPAIDWHEDEFEVVEVNWEAYLEDLFSDLEDEEDAEAFEELMDSLGWSEGEVIWEGMDFDQMFTDPGEFHAFELLSRKDQRAFLRDRLRTQQASDTAEAGESELEVVLRTGGRLNRDKAEGKETTPKPKAPQEHLVSYETETEHLPHELDLGIAHGKDERRRRRKL